MASRSGSQSFPDRPPWEQAVPVPPPRPDWEHSAWYQQRPETVQESVTPRAPSQVPPSTVEPPAPTDPAPSPKTVSDARWVFAFTSILVVSGALGVLGFLTPGWFVTTVLDPVSVREGVARTLHDEYKLGGVESVWCPTEMVAEQGATFRCAADIAGEEKRVLITVQDQQGTYEVGYPT